MRNVSDRGTEKIKTHSIIDKHQHVHFFTFNAVLV